MNEHSKPFSVPVVATISQTLEMSEWCIANIGTYRENDNCAPWCWARDSSWDRVFQFEQEKDAVFFALRWV